MLAIALAAAAALFHLHETGRDLDFQYDWSANASAIRPLANQLRAEMKHDRARSAAEAASAYKGSLNGAYPFHRHEFARKLEFMGQSRRLASFVDYHSSYTGGAHPNSSKALLLWDKSSDREIKFADLFNRPLSPLLRTAYCKGLAAERVRKLGRATPYGDYWQTCPDPLGQAVVPLDWNRDGRFDELSVIASPYAVGSYAEGYYVVNLPVSARLIAALKPRYRSSFEAQRQ